MEQRLHKGIGRKTANDSPKAENLVHPTVENKQVIHHSSGLRIKHVSIKTDAF
jgi:hypothetical protein